MQVAVFTADGEKTSNPVIGCGGDFIVKKNKNGLEPNDEAYKMCLTDALGNALKCLGVGATVFRGKYDTKYNKPAEPIYVRKENNCTEVLGNNNRWYSLESMSLETLNKITNDSRYSQCHDEARRLMMKK